MIRSAEEGEEDRRAERIPRSGYAVGEAAEMYCRC